LHGRRGRRLGHVCWRHAAAFWRSESPYVGCYSSWNQPWALSLIVAIWSLIAISQVSAQQGPAIFLKGPYLQAPGSETMTIMWESWTNGPGILRFGLRGKLDQVARIEVPWQFNAVLKISVTNILP